MNDMSKAEALRAAREAKDRVGSSRGSSVTAVEAAMRRYLGAEQYHEQADHSDGAPAGGPPAGQRRSSSLRS